MLQSISVLLFYRQDFCFILCYSQQERKTGVGHQEELKERRKGTEIKESRKETY
jgi:hypothetical protein